MPYYTLYTVKGIREEQHSVACYIDLEGAFHTVWRNTIIFTLYKMAIEADHSYT